MAKATRNMMTRATTTTVVTGYPERRRSGSFSPAAEFGSTSPDESSGIGVNSEKIKLRVSP